MKKDAVRENQSPKGEINVFSEEVIEALKELSQINNELRANTYEQMQNKYGYHISVIEKLGRYGWTIHDSITPLDPREWIRIIEDNGEAAIAEYFTENTIDEMLDEIYQRYRNNNEGLYAERALENYRIGHYTEAAFFFLALMNYRINSLSPQNIRKVAQQCKECLKQIGRNKYDLLEEWPISRLFLIRDYIPSFQTFATRLFVDGEEHNWDKGGTEPEYLNRNWLMHGRMSRHVKRFECIQLINAFHTLADIEDLTNAFLQNNE